MPIYVYEVIADEPDSVEGSSEPSEPVTFEILESMSAPPLQFHPVTGQRVRRIIAPVKVAGVWMDMKSSVSLSNKSLSDKGFTKYVKMGDGKYEKRAGEGPDVISRD